MIELRKDWSEVVISMQRQVDWLIDDVGRRKPPTVRFSPRTWQPAIDVYETAEEVVVLVELAGVEEEEIEITVLPQGQKGGFKLADATPVSNSKNVLVIRGNRKDIKQGIKRTYTQMEILWGAFERELILPASVNMEQIKAFYEAGILEVVLPKIGKEKSRRVDIQVG